MVVNFPVALSFLITSVSRENVSIHDSCQLLGPLVVFRKSCIEIERHLEGGHDEKDLK